MELMDDAVDSKEVFFIIYLQTPKYQNNCKGIEIKKHFESILVSIGKRKKGNFS